MLIASKYEEIYAPEIRDFIYMTDKAYSKEQILETERKLLQSLDFTITAPSIYRFLERFSKLSSSDDLIFNFSRYIGELTLVETSMYKWLPSQIAASALYVAKKVQKRSSPWCPFMTQQTGYDEKQVRECAKDLCLILYKANTNQEYLSIAKKFSLPRFFEVSKICMAANEEQKAPEKKV